MEGTCLSPYTSPALRVMMMYYLFGSYHIRGSPSGGVKSRERYAL